MINLKEARNEFLFRPITPLKIPKHSSFYNTKETIEYEPRLIFGEMRKSVSTKHEFQNLSMDKYLKFQEKIDESGFESFKDFPQNSFYNDLSEEKLLDNYNQNTLELVNPQYSNQSEERMKNFLENIKEKNLKKYVIIISEFK